MLLFQKFCGLLLSPLLRVCMCACMLWCLPLTLKDSLPCVMLTRRRHVGKMSQLNGPTGDSFVKWQTCGRDKGLLGSAKNVTQWLSWGRPSAALQVDLVLVLDTLKARIVIRKRWGEAHVKIQGSALSALHSGDDEGNWKIAWPLRTCSLSWAWRGASQPRKDI